MLDNLPVYWPPRLPNHHHDFSDNETVYFSIMEENLKFLVDEETVDTENTGGCCSNEQCNIF